MITLRPYQTVLMDQIRRELKAGVGSVLVQAPTGSGKTALTAHMIANSAAAGWGCWFVVHRQELVRQSEETFDLVGVPHGVIAAGVTEHTDQRVQIVSIQTIARRLGRYAAPRLIIWDEAHHTVSTSWSRVRETFPGALHVGLTATPERLDGLGLAPWYSSLVTGPSVEWLIEHGFLAPYRLFAPGLGAALEGIHTRAGDYARDELSEALDRPKIVGDAVSHYLKLAAGRRAIVFCCSIAHSEHVVRQFRAAGIAAQHVDGETPTSERMQALYDFRNNRLKVISNVDLFGEGLDVPGIEAVILLRPTKSLGLYLQQVGRGLRVAEGKPDCLILDHAGNAERHGLPDDEREWTLDGKKRRSSDEPKVNIRLCKNCFAANKASAQVCFACGAAFIVVPREVPQVDGQLEEIDKKAVRKSSRLEQGLAQSYEDLVRIERARGHKPGWAMHVWRGRQKRMG